MTDDRRFGRTRSDRRVDRMHDHDIMEHSRSRKAKERFDRPAYGVFGRRKQDGE